MKSYCITIVLFACALLSCDAEGLQPGGLNRHAFSVDTETKMEEVLRENEARVVAAKHKYAFFQPRITTADKGRGA